MTEASCFRCCERKECNDAGYCEECQKAIERIDEAIANIEQQKKDKIKLNTSGGKNGNTRDTNKQDRSS